MAKLRSLETDPLLLAPTRDMPHIVIISASVRNGRKSHNVALYLLQYLLDHPIETCEILDLKAYNFPLFDATLKAMPQPEASVLAFAQKVKSADGIILVTPEYNGGFPASLKNVIDLLYDEWHGKPIGICTVSSGIFGGAQALVSLEFILWKMGANIIQQVFQVPNIDKMYNELGIPHDKNQSDDLVKLFIEGLLKNIH